MRLFRRGHLGSESDRATFRTLHTASLASPALREGLTATSAEKSLNGLLVLSPRQRKLQKLQSTLGTPNPPLEHEFLRGLLEILVLQNLSRRLPGRLSHAPSIGSLPRSVKDIVWKGPGQGGEAEYRKKAASRTSGPPVPLQVHYHRLVSLVLHAWRHGFGAS